MDSRFDSQFLIEAEEYPVKWYYGVSGNGTNDYYSTPEAAMTEFIRLINASLRGYASGHTVRDTYYDGSRWCLRDWTVRNVKKNGEVGKMRTTIQLVRVTEARYFAMLRGK